ncbi:ROK family protein [Spiroplasma floricola]|uniref:Glucokinase n=1 Tax=Spiroplasma floricola 23-6 TaxID=1336749 RepID=A0A2K8SE40_9MOLU|nr:ROK family protein [Spiroplasma floricola]AUB31498.1 glucokinase [Spiroplasma floricola 23-6]
MNEIRVGVDIGGTHIKYAFIKENEIIYKNKLDTPKKDIIEFIFEQINISLEKENINYDDVLSISLTIPGIIFKTGNATSVNLGWDNYPALQEAKEIFKNKKIAILNDAKAAVYGEYVHGLKMKKPNVLMYTIGTGIGSGTIINKQLYLGNNTGMVGEVHGGSFQNKKDCKCGQGGCVEAVSGAQNIERILNERKNELRLKDSELLKKEKVSIKDLKNEILSDNQQIYDIFYENLLPLTDHMATMIHMFDFDVIVIGGGVSKLGDYILKIIEKQIKSKILKPYWEALDLRLAKLQNDAGIIGVVEYLKNNLEG